MLFLFLTGCTSEIRKEFPEIPPSLSSGCSELDIIADRDSKLSDILIVITANYAKYHECKLKVDTWIEWYNEQQKHFYIR
jgi:hypothetical protein